MKFQKAVLVGLSMLTLGGIFSIAEPVKAANLTVDVTSYGANGTDMAADTKAIQAALDDVAEAGAGTVTVPAGKYYLDDSLVIYSNTTLSLAANATMIRKDPAKPMLRDYKGAVDTVLAGKGYGHAKNIKITGGVWDGNIKGESASTPEGIMRIYCATNVTISDSTLTGVCGFHHINLAAVDTAVITNVKFTGFVKYTGTNYKSLETGEGNSNELNSTASITSEALQIDYFDKKEYYCKNVTVSNCTFDGVLSGVGNHHKESMATNITIKNNTFQNIQNTCVNLYSFQNVTVSNNKAANVRAFARVCGGKDCTISGNTISTYTNASKNKFNMFRISDKAVLTIENNVISGAGVSAVKLDSGSSAKINNNTIKSPTLNGIMVNDSSADISGNAISAAGNDAVWYSDGSGSVKNNNINTTKRFGVFTTKSKVDIGNNVVTNSAESGIYMKSGSGNIAGNSVSSNKKGSGIYVTDKAKTGQINNNVVMQSGENGIYVKGASADTVSGNTVQSSKGKGISIYSATAKLYGNVVKSSKMHGIYIFKGKATVSDTNKVSGSKDRGLRVSGGKVYVESGNAKMLVNEKDLIVSGAADKKMKVVTIPAKVKFDKEIFRVTQIGNNAFKNQKKLTKVVIGKNVSQIGNKAFYKCKNLKNVIIKSDKLSKYSVANDAFLKMSKKCKFKLPAKKSKEYQSILKAAGV